MMNAQKTLAAAAILAAAGTTFAQVSPGSFTPDATDDMESYPGGRAVISAIFGGDVAVSGPLDFRSVDDGDWLDYRAPGGTIQPTSGNKFATIFGFGAVTFDFTSIGGITAFGFSASAAGVGDDTITFFDLDGIEIGQFSDSDGYGPGDGTMEDKAWTSDVVIGSITVDGPETAFDDIAIAEARERLSCEGFQFPMDSAVTVKRYNSYPPYFDQPSVLPLTMRLLDESGEAVFPQDLSSPPVVEVLFDGEEAGEAVPEELPYVGFGDDGNRFEFAQGFWRFYMGTETFGATGTYYVAAISRDPTEYYLDPTCVGTFTIVNPYSWGTWY